MIGLRRRPIPVHPPGPLANRPPAATQPDGTEYYASDDNGGQRWVVDAGQWAKRGPAVLARGGAELARTVYAGASETHTQQADLTGASITFTVTDRPVDVEAWVPVASNATAGQEILLQITDPANAEKARGAQSSSIAAKPLSLRAVERITVPGTYTRKMRIGNNQVSGGGVVTVYGTGTGAQFTPFIKAVER